MPAWTEEEDEKLIGLLGKGLSMSRIGDAMGRPRNSVLGRVHRLGLNEPSALKLRILNLARSFPRATIFEIAEATALEPKEIEHALKRNVVRESGSPDAYRPDLVAKMRAQLMHEEAA